MRIENVGIFYQRERETERFLKLFHVSWELFARNEMVLQGMYHKRESCGVTLMPPVESKAAFGTGGTCHRCHVSALFQHQTNSYLFQACLK